MRNKINEEVLCVLKYKNNELIIDYEPIEQHFLKEVKDFTELCNNNSDNIAKICSYIKTTESIKKLQKEYKYCRNLAGSFQAFEVNLEERIKDIIQSTDLLYYNTSNDKADDISILKCQLNKEFILWVAAYNIEKTYRKCFNDKQVLTFSHRIVGWSNPEYQLSENFTVELKTNFGFGSASYFYIILKYKNIEITPFSEWIDYEFANFSEIVRYSKSFSDRIIKDVRKGKRLYKIEIKNTAWQEAIDFTKTACNISLKNEEGFIRQYIIDECDRMVSGLEYIYRESEYIFKREHGNHYKIDKSGHQLMEFRGEKISGALNFITKILEFDGIAEIKSFITRIEDLNRKIQPLLAVDIKNIELKLADLKSEIKVLKPKFLELVKTNENYTKKIDELKMKSIDNKEEINREFTNKYPEFDDFKKEFSNVQENLKILNDQIQNFTKISKNITTYNLKIINHFRK